MPVKKLIPFACAAALAAGPAFAADAFPTKPVRMVVPFAAGGGVDLTARILAQKLTERIGQSVIVDNRVGASGIIGTEYVAKSNPDGYTLLVGSQTSQAVVPAMYGKLNYDTVRDFVGVTEIAVSPLVIVILRDPPCPDRRGRCRASGCRRAARP